MKLQFKQQDFQIKAVQAVVDVFADNIKPYRTANDLLKQVLLDWGLPLFLKMEEVEISGKQVFKVAENSLYACFDTEIDEAIVKAISKEKQLQVVFKDSSFKNDTAKTNVWQLLKQFSRETEVRVLWFLLVVECRIV